MPRPRTGPVTRVARYAVNTMLVVAILGGLAYLLPSVLGYDRYVITGGSMSGAFEKGDMVFEREQPVGGLEVGDVITYLPPADAGTQDLVTHRIVAIDVQPDGTRVLQTKGDANADPDPWRFSLDQPTQPVMEFSVPKIGHLFIALARPDVRLLLLGVPATIIALLAAADLVRALRRRDDADSAADNAADNAADVGARTPRRRRLRVVA